MTYHVIAQPWHRPLRVTATMEEPVVYKGDGMHLDGILAWSMYARMSPRRRRGMPPMSAPWVIDVPLPLARWIVDVGPAWDGERLLLHTPAKTQRGPHQPPRQHGGKKKRTTWLWGWCASSVQAEVLARGVAEIRKRPALDEMRQYARDRTVSVKSGTLKAYDLALPTVFARELVWYAHGEIDKIADLLRGVEAVGKKVALGWGRVGEWRVEEVDDDYSIERAGKLMRRMPVQSGLPGTRRVNSIRPPYHHRSRVVEAVEPAC